MLKTLFRVCLAAALASGARGACPDPDAADVAEEQRKLMMMGGFTGWKQSTPSFEAEIRATLVDLEQRVAADFAAMKSTGLDVAAASPEICQYKSQVVAGTNYDLMVSAGDMTYAVRVFKPLPYTREPPRITSFERLE